MRSKLTIYGIVLFLIASGIFTWSYFTLKPSDVMNNSVNAKNIINPPVKLDHPSIYHAYLTYGFTGKITRTNNTPQGVQLILDISDNKIPQFLVTPKTTVRYAAKGKYENTNISRLRPSQKVYIQNQYDLKTNIWKTTIVSIEVSKLPT